MTPQVIFRSCITACALLFLVGCSTRPQADLTYTGDISESGFSRFSPPSKAARARLEEQKQRELATHMEVSVLGKPQEDATLGFGFVGNSDTVFQVFPTGQAMLYPKGAAEIELEKGIDRIFNVFLAGPSKRHIIGASHHGTQMSWNGVLTSEQLMINPQIETIKRSKALDIAGVNNANYLVVGHDDGTLRKYSLVSGDLTAQIKLANDEQPRRINRDGSYNAVVFGTNTGVVGMWSGRQRTLYTHSGPVLDIDTSKDQKWIVSSSKDGTGILYNRSSGQVVKRFHSKRAVYNVAISPNGRFAYFEPLPRAGRPILYDTFEQQEVKIYTGASDWPRQIEFATSGDKIWLLSQSGKLRTLKFGQAMSVKRIDAQAPRPIQKMIPVPNANLMLWLTKDDKIHVTHPDTGKIYSTLFQSSTPILDIDVSARYVAALLEDGRIVRLRINHTTEDTYWLRK